MSEYFSSQSDQIIDSPNKKPEHLTRAEKELIIWENTAKEAIKLGLVQLAKTFKQIFEKRGSLPSSLVLPETTTRPLYYSIKPLAEKVYEACGQKPPLIFFIKTFTLISGDNSTKILEQRLGEIKDKTGGGSLLFIDDVVSSGARTFSSLARVVNKLGFVSDAYFFSFLANEDARLRLDGLIPWKNFSYGVGFYEQRDNENLTFDWLTLLRKGFPYREKKEQITGVKKDQTSANPYVEISPLADPAAKKAERKKYAAWGKEAVEKIFAEKGAVVVKS